MWQSALLLDGGAVFPQRAQETKKTVAMIPALLLMHVIAAVAITGVITLPGRRGQKEAEIKAADAHGAMGPLAKDATPGGTERHGAGSHVAEA